MVAADKRKNPLLVLGKIIVLVIIAAAVIRSYFVPSKVDFIDPYEFAFVLFGGVALLLISFAGAGIRRTLLYLSGGAGDYEGIRHSAFFWEAAARSFWMVGGLAGVLNLMIFFIGMKTLEVYGIGMIIDRLLIRSLLAMFYGILLSVACLVPYWRLAGKLKSQALPPNVPQGESGMSSGRPGRIVVAASGYILFLAVMAFIPFNFSIPSLWSVMSEIVHSPALLLVLGGTLVLMLFSGESNAAWTVSASFAVMGLIGALLGSIHVLYGFAASSRSANPSGILAVASGSTFVLFSCFAALAGLVLVGAPLADRAIQRGRIAAPSSFSRISWYGFPLLILVLAPLFTVVVTMPLPKPEHQLTEVSAPVQEEKVSFEARAPQSEPVKMPGEFMQKANLIYKVNPAYPEQAKRESIQGIVKLRIIINEEGFVYEAKGIPGNNPVLEQAAIPAVKRWRFSPLTMKGMPVAVEETAKVTFELK